MELFTLCKDKTERRAFVDNLLRVAAPGGVTTVVLTLHADFYGHCAEYEGLRTALAADRIYIGTMTATSFAHGYRGASSSGRLAAGARFG